MGKRLWTKFALSHLAIAVMAVALAAILFNLALSRKFQGYVEENQRLRDEQMVVLLGSIYEKERRWNPLRIQDVSNLWMMSGREITVFDSEGRQVFDCWDSMREMGPSAQKKMMGMGMMCDWGWNQQPQGYGAPRTGGQPPTPPKPDTQNVEGRRVPVFVGEKQVGTAVIKQAGNQGPFSPQDKSFQATVNHWLWGVALGAGAFALLVSLGMARRLSQPIRALTTGAKTLRNGDLTQRVKIEGKDEVGQLAHAFNHLAESLERQEKYRKKLTGDLAHELRTPLANLQTHIEGLIDGVLPSTPENLTSIHEEILRLGRLVGNLEELNRAEASRLNLKWEETDLRALLERTVSQFQPRYFDKNVDLTVSLPEDPLELSLDQDKISQVVNNLLSNALKFTPKGGSVEVAATRKSRDIEISVRDTGIGISEEDLPFIFERFFRGGNGENGAKGSGIGLTIAKELTEAHGGKIEVKSALNHGTEFTLRLPLTT
jgi:two-component system sensor histidine kinase BaeS